MKSPKTPNIVFYFTDQQRPDTCGCYGQALPVTPNLDRLAADGAVFDNAFTCQPVCGPARAALQTGLYPAALGCYRNAIALPAGVPTLAGLLHAAGYRTGYVGKWHLASTLGRSHENLPPAADFERRAVPPERRGGYADAWVAADVLEATSHGYGGYLFDAEGQKHIFSEAEYRADAVTDYALDFIRGEAERTAPFFLMLSHLEPHHQNDRGHFEGPHGSAGRWAGAAIPSDLKNAPGDWGANFRQEYADYLGCCHALDENLGRVVDTLRESGQLENTAIVFASDHGSHFRTRCMEYKRSCHDASIRVPLVIWNGGFGHGVRYDRPVSLIDLPPTLLRMAGVTPPAGWHGHALQGLLTAPEAWQEEIYIQISESEVARAVRTPEWCYCVRAYDKNPWQDAGSDVWHEEYLYDLRADPDETVNRIYDPALAAVRTELRERLCARMAAADEPALVILPPLPPSTVDLGLNGTVADFWAHARYGPLLRTKLPRLRPADGDDALRLRELPAARPSEADAAEVQAFLAALIDEILGIDAD